MRRALRTTVTTGSIFIVSFIFNAAAGAVPVMHNEAVLHGVVEEHSLTQSGLVGIVPEQIIYKFVISVRTVEDVNAYPNFIRGKEGRSMIFYSKEKQSSDLLNKEVKAVVEYRGDERGGLFWIKKIEVIK
ncbi:MAG: hypothetical protein HZC48_11810 [Nitrospirae bacterium]|nr:hypothetical protein [Nitrospirota bacterium]